MDPLKPSKEILKLISLGRPQELGEEKSKQQEMGSKIQMLKLLWHLRKFKRKLRNSLKIKISKKA